MHVGTRRIRGADLGAGSKSYLMIAPVPMVVRDVMGWDGGA